MDIVLGVSMAPTSVRMLLVEGENADGVTIEDNQFDIADDDDAATLSAADQVISAILGTREGATEAGHALTSTGVTWTDPVDAAGLHEALATRKIENVMLVSAFMAAAALAQSVGNTVGDHHTALLFLERDTATLAVVDSADGAISDVHKELIPGDSVAELAGMLAGLDELETQPQSVFIVGTGVDVAAIKPQLETLTALPVTAAEEPETALAWGAALASANAPLFASSTAALAYAQDPGTGAVDPFAVSPGYLAAPDVPFGTELGEEDLAYSAVPDEEAEVHTVAQDVITDEHLDDEPERRPLVLVGSILAVVFVAAALSLEVALALGIRPSVALLPRPLQNLIIQAPAPAAAPANVQVPEANHLIAPAIAPAPANAPIPAPRPAAPALVPAAAPIPVPAAPPVPVAAPAPVVVPLPLPIPVRAPEPVHAAPLPVPVHVPSPPPPVHLPQPVHLPSPQQVGRYSLRFICRSRCRSRASRTRRGTCRLRGRGRTVPTPGSGDAGPAWRLWWWEPGLWWPRWVRRSAWRLWWWEPGLWWPRWVRRPSRRLWWRESWVRWWEPGLRWWQPRLRRWPRWIRRGPGWVRRPSWRVRRRESWLRWWQPRLRRWPRWIIWRGPWWLRRRRSWLRRRWFWWGRLRWRWLRRRRTQLRRRRSRRRAPLVRRRGGEVKSPPKGRPGGIDRPNAPGLNFAEQLSPR